MKLQEWKKIAGKWTSCEMVWDILRDWEHQVTWRDCVKEPPEEWAFVLLYTPKANKDRGILYHHIGNREMSVKEGKYIYRDGHGWLVCPTHWMPLPSFPQWGNNI